MRRMEAVKPPVSYADLQRMPDDGHRYELYDGELWMVPSPFTRHQRISRRLFLALDVAAVRNGGEAFFAPLDIVFSEYNVVQPDLVYFGSESAQRVPANAAVRFSPDAVFEVMRKKLDVALGRYRWRVFKKSDTRVAFAPDKGVRWAVVLRNECPMNLPT